MRWMGMGTLLLVGLLAGCDEEDVVSLRIRLREDLSGSMVVSSIGEATQVSPVESGAEGVEWEERLALSMTSGSFARLSGMAFHGLTFDAGTSAGLGYLRVRIPRGPEATWVDALVPGELRATERKQRLSEALGGTRLARVASSLKIVVELPGDALAHGLNTRALGLEEEVQGAEVSLVVPFDLALGEDPDIVWHLTWDETP